MLARQPDRVAATGLAVAEVVEGDITDAAAVERAVAGCDTVYRDRRHVPRAEPQRPALPRGQCGRRALMMDAARRHGVRRVVHCSTVGIHGNVVGPPATEATPIRPDGIYEVTKAEGDRRRPERGARRARGRGDPARPVYGPGDTRLVKLYKLAGARAGRSCSATAGRTTT